MSLPQSVQGLLKRIDDLVEVVSDVFPVVFVGCASGVFVLCVPVVGDVPDEFGCVVQVVAYVDVSSVSSCAYCAGEYGDAVGECLRDF